MSTQDRYTKIIESLVNGDEAGASDLLHEAFVEKAREIWSGLVEQDDIAEDEIAEEELEEAISDEEADDFLGDIETAEDDIESEEAFGEADDEDEGEMDMDMGDMDDMEELADDGEGEEDHGDVEDAMVSVEDALEDLKAAFAAMTGMSDDAEEAGDDEEEMEEEFTFESEEDEDLEESADEDDADETLEEAASLNKVGKDGAIHPVDMPAGDDGKASPVAGKNDMGGEVIQTGAKGSEGSSKGLSDESAKDMGVTHPGDGAKLSPETRGHGAEKKGKTA